MNIIEFHDQAKTQASRKWITGYKTLVLAKNAIKVRLTIRENLYIDLYFNQRYGTINYTLILENERIYGRDCYEGKWHLHPYDEPSKHDLSENGKKNLSIENFVNEAEEILTKLNLL
ncbi:MAG: hypothetical protein STSR0004_18640 [Peptococcaceae bacterium]